MNNRFGLKDFVLLALVLGVGVSVFLSMVQEDRRWARMNELAGKIESQENQIGQLIRRLDERENDLRELVTAVRATQQQLGDVAAALKSGASIAPSSSPRAADSPTAITPMSTRADDSWARPGVPVTRPKDRYTKLDSSTLPGYAEGGSFTEIFEAQPPRIMPYTYADTYGRRITEMVAEFLADFDNDGKVLQGVLAEAWQYDPNGMWLRAKLRPNARFSDGSPVTAEDVRYTFHDYMFNPEIEAERFRSVYNPIKKVSVIAPDVVEFEFVAPKFNNDQLALRLAVIPKSFYSKLTPSEINGATGLLMGSGPYKLATLDPASQWRPGQDIVLVRNEQYWGPLPAIRELRFKVITDGVARMVNYENGEGGMIRPTFEQYARKKTDPEFVKKNTILAWPNIRSGYAFIAWNCGERLGKLTPFHDARVRLAMTHLLDRERIKRDVYEDQGLVATGPFNPFAEQADPEVKPWPFDLARARELLAEAGWRDTDSDGVLENPRGDEFTFEFTYATGSEAGKRIAAYLQDQCAKVGIRCTTRVIDWSVFQTAHKSRDFDALTMQWSPNDPEIDPFQVWHSKSIANQGDNFSQWRSERADALIEQARLELDHDKRMKLWHELHRVIHDEQPYTFLCNLPWLRFVETRLSNIKTYPMGLDFREWYIPADQH